MIHISSMSFAETNENVKIELESNLDWISFSTSLRNLGAEKIQILPEGTVILEIDSSRVTELEGLQGVKKLQRLSETLNLQVSSSAVSSGFPFGLGGKAPSEEEQRYIDANLKSVERISPTPLAQVRTFLQGSGTLPEFVDNSASQYFPPIGSQGSQNSCGSWATGYYYNTYVQAKDEDLDAASGNKDYLCSPTFIYPLVNDGTDTGSYIYDNFVVLERSGCANLNLTPYRAANHSSFPDEEDWIEGLRRRMKNKARISLYGPASNPDEGLNNLKQYLANGEIAVFGFPVYSNWYGGLSGGGLNNHVLYEQRSLHMGYHAMTVVGYDDNREYEVGEEVRSGAFLIANSWSSGWGTRNSIGNKGYMWIAYELFKEQAFSVYYAEDRPQYRSKIYAMTHIDHPDRIAITYSGGAGDPLDPDWSSLGVFWRRGSKRTLDERIALDFTDVLNSGINMNPLNLFVSMANYYSSSPKDGILVSAEFFVDLDGDEIYESILSPDSNITVNEGNTAYASVTLDMFLTVNLSSSIAGLTNNSSIPVLVEFSEDVTGFDQSDLQVTNASVSDFSSESGNTYRFNLNPSGEGALSVQILGDAANGSSGFGNQASNTLSFTYDSSPPILNFVSSVGTITNSSSFSVELTSSEELISISIDDIHAPNAELSNFTSTGINTYQFDIAPTSEGLITVSIPAGTLSDLAGNTNSETSLSITYDISGPIGTISSSVSTYRTNISPVTISIEFNEDVEGLEIGDFVTTNLSLGPLNGSGNLYTLELTPTNEGELFSITLPAETYSDSLGNINSNELTITKIYDITAPSVNFVIE